MAIRAFKAIASAFRRAMDGVPRFIAPLPTSAAVSPPAVNRAIMGNMTAITIPITRHGGITRWPSLTETITNIARQISRSLKMNSAPGGSGAEVSGIAWDRSDEHTYELQSLMRNSYHIFCLKKKNSTIDTKAL